MQFNTGSNGLVATTRFLVNDSGANDLFSTATVKAAVNFAYLDIYNEIVAAVPEWFLETSFADTVASQVFYAMPSDMNQMLEVVVEYDGKNIDTDTTASPKRLQKLSWNKFAEEQRAGSSGKYFWSPFKEHFAIYPTVDSGSTGTSSLRIVFVVEPTELSADSDEPLIPTSHHRLIAVRAARHLAVPMGLDESNLVIQDNRMTQNLYNNLRRDRGDSDQFPSMASQSTYTPIGKQGVGS